MEGISDNTAEDIRIRSKCGTKKAKYLINLEKFNDTGSQISKIIVNYTELTDHKKTK